jgi:hypothetical protein
MEEIEYESFNLQKEVDNKLNSIITYRELHKIDTEIDNIKSQIINNYSLKQLNKKRHEKKDLEEQNINNEIGNNEVQKYIENNKISILNRDKKYNNYNFNIKLDNEDITLKLLFINSIISDLNFKNINNSLLNHIVLDDCEIT